MFNKVKKIGMFAFSMVAGVMLFSRSYFAGKYLFHFRGPGDGIFSWSGKISANDESVSVGDMAKRILNGGIGHYSYDYDAKCAECFKDKELWFFSGKCQLSPDSPLNSCTQTGKGYSEVWVCVHENIDLSMD